MYEMCKCHQLCTFRERRFQFRHRCLHCHQVCESGRQSGRHRKESRQSEDSGQPMPISDDQRSKCLLILSIIVIQKKHFKLQVLEVIADLTSREDIQRLFDTTISEYGRLDVLVNNAGIVGQTDIEDTDVVNKFDWIMDTNVRAVVQLCQLAVPHLKQSNGNIVSVSSVASTKPVSHHSSVITHSNRLINWVLQHNVLFGYCCAKSCVDMITKCLAIDLGPKGIRVNAVKWVIQTMKEVLNYKFHIVVQSGCDPN